MVSAIISTREDISNSNLIKRKDKKIATVWHTDEVLRRNYVDKNFDRPSKKNRRWFQRTWWFFTVALSFSCCAYLMVDLWMKRNVHPVTVVFDDKILTIGTIPFPAVTLCPATRIAVDKLNITDMEQKFGGTSLKNATSEEVDKLRGAIHICAIAMRRIFQINETNMNGTDGESFFTRIGNLGMDRKNIFRSCVWAGQRTGCQKFKYIMTEKGPCYSFNVLNSDRIYNSIISPEILTIKDNPDEGDWVMENELQKLLLPVNIRRKIAPHYPFYLRTLDDLDSLNLSINFEIDDWLWNYKCEAPVTKSFKVFLHRPDEMKEAFDRPFEVEVGRKVVALVKPMVIVTSQHLKRYSPSVRKCFFNSERQLKFFRYYTKSNCEHECLTNFTKEACGCVKFSMPRDSETRICDVKDLTCYSAAIKKHREIGFANDTSAAEYRGDCDCLPACADIQYATETNDLKYVKEKVKQKTSDKITILTISYKSSTFLTLKRTEAYPVPHLVATCGGLLGLFMGISILSVLEMVVYSIAYLAHKFSTRKNMTQIYLNTQANHVNVLPPVV